MSHLKPFAKISFTLALLLPMFALSLSSCGDSAKNKPSEDVKSIGVFIPGVVSGSPIYEMLASGAQKAVDEYNNSGKGRAELTVIEGGFNQAEWETTVTTMAASGSYDLIVSSNPSLPDIVTTVSAKFPDQYFLLLDGQLSGNNHVYTLQYNQKQQAYMAGTIAALETESLLGTLGGSAKQSGGQKASPRRVGLIAAQEYPVMNNIIKPSYLEGAKAIDQAYELEFRIVGNWYDAAKAAELTSDLIGAGVKVILCIAGGANEGIVQTAGNNGAKVVWFDTNGYTVRPGTVVGSAVLYQDKAAYNQLMRYFEGTLPFGTAETVGVADGYVGFIEDDPDYIAGVPEEVRKRQAEIVKSMEK